MEKVFISELQINKVRHLENLTIPLAEDEIKHLLITGKNGSGKTSLLEALAGFLDGAAVSGKLLHAMTTLETEKLNSDIQTMIGIEAERNGVKNRIQLLQERFDNVTHGVFLKLNQSMDDMRTSFQKGNFIIAYYKANRIFETQVPKHVEKVELKDSYSINDTPRTDFVKYLLDLKMTEALAVTGGKQEKAEKIRAWYEKFQNLLQQIFENKDLKLEFDEDTFRFSICIPGREPFDFNTLSSGYAAVLDIVVDIIIRMEKQTNRTFQFDVPGIVLVDEIETHLHLEMQKNILKLLTTIFPNIQFIVSTHSPFILNSIENAVIYDLENHTLVENGLVDIPYEGIVEGYFRADTMSAVLKEKYDRYKTLVRKETLSDNDFEEIAKLEMFLDEIPDYLALELTTEYRRLKLELESREDL